MSSEQINSRENKSKNYINVSVINPKECIFCKNKNVVKVGFRFNHTTKKQRWKCKSCSKLFTVDDGFFKTKHKPLILFTDGLHGYRKIYRKVWGARNRKIDNQPYIRLKADRDKRNNLVERIQGAIRERIKVMRAFKNKESAKLILDLFVIYYNCIRIHQGINKTPIEQAGINFNLCKNK